MTRVRLVPGLALALALAGEPAAACSERVDCPVAHGAYRVSPPAGWDGRSRLPVAFFYHGWQQTADDVMRHRALVEAFSEVGVLLVALDGLGKTWSYPGSPSRARDDVAFTAEVVDDVAKRFPIDPERLWATGFSQGGSMVWSLACLGGGRFAAFVPVAGAFWEPLPTACPSGPVNLYHVHGLSDETVPMAGRPIGTRFRQGNVLEGMALWRGVNACPAAPTRTARDGALDCSVWAGCDSGRELRLCLHGEGHEYRPEWVGQGWTFVDRVARAGGAASVGGAPSR